MPPKYPICDIAVNPHCDAQTYYICDMKSLAERLIWARQQKNWTQKDLAAAIGAGQSTIAGLENGSRLSSRRVVAMAGALGISPEWLAEGKGTPHASTEVAGAVGVGVLEGPNDNYPAVRRVNLRLTAGISGFAVEPLEEDLPPIMFSRHWYDKNGYKPEKLLAIRVHGASMEPGLYDGDWVVINTADTAPKDGQVYALNYDGESVVKRLFKMDGQWCAASDNPDKRIYRDRLVTELTFVVGRVVHKQSERI